MVFQKSIQPQIASDIEDLQTFTAKRLLDTPIVYPTMHPLLEKEAQEKIPSMRGEMGEMVNQLRDPDIFKDADGQLYLLYTGAGEQGIGIAILHTG